MPYWQPIDYLLNRSHRNYLLLRLSSTRTFHAKKLMQMIRELTSYAILEAANQDLWLQACFICFPWDDIWEDVPLERRINVHLSGVEMICRLKKLEWHVCQWHLQALTFFVAMAAARANALGFFKFTDAFNRVWLSTGKVQGTSDTIHSALDTCQSMTLSTFPALAGQNCKH
jgi:hypothetical protein